MPLHQAVPPIHEPLTQPNAVLNLAAYRFVALSDLPALQARLLALAQHQRLLGTVLLAPEGINFNLAGQPDAARQWMAQLSELAPFAGLQAKKSFSATQPFKRLKVKIKREIIRMNEAGIAPAAGRAPEVNAQTLQRWLAQGHCDEGRPLALLDTRNAFEVDAGSFAGALDWRIGKFSDFPAAFAQHREQLHGHTVVSFCTGGIRCEKANLWMQSQGQAHTYQLEGGILNYFEATQGRAPGWQGHCVVFDQRGQVDSHLTAP